MSKNDLPKVSVIVPVYNGVVTIGACIESLLAQEYPRDQYEIIVVDNNSTDGTDQIIRRYPVKLVYEKNIQTSYAARNRGIQHATGNIVAFTDSDCRPKPDWLDRLVSRFSDPDVVGVAGFVQAIDRPNLISRFLAEIDPVRPAVDSEHILAITANVAYRRDVLIEVGLFNPKLFTAGDIDLSVRIQQQENRHIVVASDAIVMHEFGTTWRELHHRFFRYGYSEIVMAHLHCDDHSLIQQQYRIRKQLQAMLIYFSSFLWRISRGIWRGFDKPYNLWPILWLVVEGSDLTGKLRALWDYRYSRNKPQIR